MPTCPACESNVETLYDCRQCGGSFCVDCRLPDDHECAGETADQTSSGSWLPGFLGEWRWYHFLIAIVWFGYALLGQRATSSAEFTGMVFGSLVGVIVFIQAGRWIWSSVRSKTTGSPEAAD